MVKLIGPCNALIRLVIIAERIGGQVNETMGIENLISVPQTTGKQLAQDQKKHLAEYINGIVGKAFVFHA